MYRRSYIILLLALLATVALAAGESITSVVKQVKPAVVTVITYDNADVQVAQGSGFFIDSRHVITNWHVIDEAVRVDVKAADGSTYHVKRIAAGDEASDLANLELETANTGVVPLRIADAMPEPGERVVVVGSPLGLEATISDGVVSEVRELPQLGRVLQISAPVSRGSSGSPVVNLKGEVVGVAQAIRAGGQNLNFAIPAQQVLALKPGGSRPLASAPAGTGAGPGTVAGSAYNTGRGLLQRKAYKDALPYFVQVTKDNPKNYMAWFGAGHCYTQMRQYKEALAAFMTVVRLKPDFSEAYTSMGAVLGLLRQYPTAIDAFKEAIRIDPESAVAHYGLGLIYTAVNETQLALQEYKILRALDPEMAADLFKTIYSGK